MTGFIPVHYKPYDDEPSVCGAEDGNTTHVQDDVTCEDCKYEIR